jgi:hypothetical protein
MLLLVSCSSQKIKIKPTVTSHAEPTQESPPSSIEATLEIDIYDGEWVGTTEQEKPIQFSIKDNTITNFQVEFDPPVCSSYMQISNETQALTGNQFELEIMFGATRLFLVRGTINAQDEMSGTLTAEESILCEAINLQWSASR